jgi:hypothetical protein
MLSQRDKCKGYKTGVSQRLTTEYIDMIQLVIADFLVLPAEPISRPAKSGEIQQSKSQSRCGDKPPSMAFKQNC